MKKNFTISALFIFAMILSATLTGYASVQAKKGCVSNNIAVASAPEVSANVVINEVYGGSEDGGVYNADFIELYNPTADAVNISDYSVQYYTAGQINSGAPTSTAHIPDATSIPAFGFYVIRVSPADRSGAALPCASLDASASFAETGIAGDGGKLVLSSTGADLPDCTSSLNVVDRIGWGLTPEFECNELFNAGKPAASKSVQRRSGRADTDNNSTDFTAISAPTPCAQILAPTAAMISVSGNVTNSSGIGISGVVISMTDSNGLSRTATTDLSGFYSFSDVMAGDTYIFTAAANRIKFVEPSFLLSLSDNVAEVNFIGNTVQKSKNIRRF